MLPHFYSHISLTIFVLAGLAILCNRRGWLPGKSGYLLIIALPMLNIPFPDLSVTAYLRSALGDISIITTVLLADRLWSAISGQDFLNALDKKYIFVLAGISGILLYPWFLGLSLFDPYALGFKVWPLAVVPFLFCLYAIRKGASGFVLILCIAAIGFHLHLLESDNLWDYFIDPLLAVYSMFWITRRLLKEDFLKRFFRHEVS